jgi:hypothetical protein
MAGRAGRGDPGRVWPATDRRRDSGAVRYRRRPAGDVVGSESIPAPFVQIGNARAPGRDRRVRRHPATLYQRPNSGRAVVRGDGDRLAAGPPRAVRSKDEEPDASMPTLRAGALGTAQRAAMWGFRPSAECPNTFVLLGGDGRPKPHGRRHVVAEMSAPAPGVPVSTFYPVMADLAWRNARAAPRLAQASCGPATSGAALPQTYFFHPDYETAEGGVPPRSRKPTSGAWSASSHAEGLRRLQGSTKQRGAGTLRVP